MPDFIAAVIINALANAIGAALYEALKAAVQKRLAEVRTRTRRKGYRGKHFRPRR